MRLTIIPISMLVISASVLSGQTSHRQFSQSDKSHDEIEIASHVAIGGSPVTRFVATEHYGHDYLYAEHSSGNTLTLIDVTKADQPAVLADNISLTEPSASLVAATGDTALLASSDISNSATGAAPRTFRIMSFSDPQHPVVREQLEGVTSMGRDEKHGLIFLANSQGIWILRERHAISPAFEKEWEHMMLDNH